jgi:hypothetical protein
VNAKYRRTDYLKELNKRKQIEDEALLLEKFQKKKNIMKKFLILFLELD